MDKKGFTLVEAVIVLALVSLLILAGSGSISGLAPRYQLQRAVWEVRSRLNQARIRSVWEGVSVRVRLSSGAIALEQYDEKGKTWKTLQTEFLEGVRIEANNSPIFHPTGTVTGLATILVSNSRGAYRITLAISGRIKVVKI
ncbi:prepilin-type N-terminal cleavage/methylation domain-containing protein [bacterium]|jgi:prepilin-type N-terminal cleavage/methylation domain-containing protein|nr:MAG: prepilin-type N-terminal cleavage/methylation domain-containing protein [bacterium]